MLTFFLRLDNNCNRSKVLAKQCIFLEIFSNFVPGAGWMKNFLYNKSYMFDIKIGVGGNKENN